MRRKGGKETAWAITGHYGLYYGTFRTRKSAIMNHAWALHVPSQDGEVREYASELSEGHRRSWARCQRRGDRAVKIEMRVIG